MAWLVETRDLKKPSCIGSSCCSGIRCAEMVCFAILGFRTSLDKVPADLICCCVELCVEEDQNGFSDL